MPVAQENPGEADTDEPGIADVVGIVLAERGFEVVAFDVKFVVTHGAVTAVDADGELADFEAEFKFGVERGGDGAVVAIAEAGVASVIVFQVEVRSEVEVDKVEAEADSRNQVDGHVFAEELPAEHPVGAVAEPADIVQRELDRGAALGGGAIGGMRTFGNLGGHEVDVEPGEELLVLGTDVQVEAQVVVVELGVVDLAGVEFRGVAVVDNVVAVAEGDLVHVVAEFLEHAAVVATERNESTDVVLFVESFFRIGEDARGEYQCAQQGGNESYFCLHKDSDFIKIQSIKYIIFGICVGEKFIRC